MHQLAFYPLPDNHARSFEILDNVIIKLMYKADKKFINTITGRLRWNLEYEKYMGLVELYIII